MRRAGWWIGAVGAAAAVVSFTLPGASREVRPAPARPAPQMASSPDPARQVQELLDAVRGLPPLACELAVRGAFQSWNGGSIRPVLTGVGLDERATDLADWSRQRIEDPSVITPLAATLRDPDPCTRVVGARLLGRTRKPEALRTLRVALGHPDAPVRAAAALGLGEAAIPETVDDLVDALRDADPGVRATVAWALGEVESPQATGALSAALGDSDAAVRVNAVWALGQIEDRTAVPALIRALQDRDPRVRRAAAWALGSILG